MKYVNTHENSDVMGWINEFCMNWHETRMGWLVINVIWNWYVYWLYVGWRSMILVWSGCNSTMVPWWCLIWSGRNSMNF